MSGANVLCTICSASSPSWMYAQLLFLLSALTFLLPDDLCWKVGDVVLPKLADCDVEWKHLYVASFTIDMVNRYVRKLLSVGIPLSHPLCFPDLPLYATLQNIYHWQIQQDAPPKRFSFLHTFSPKSALIKCW